MTKREILIKTLTLCTREPEDGSEGWNDCCGCPYDTPEGSGCINSLMLDVLEYLQEEQQ